MKKISKLLFSFCLFLGGVGYNPLNISAQTESTRASVSQDVRIYSVCYAGRTTTTYFGTVYSSTVLVKEGAIHKLAGYDTIFGTMTGEMLVYRYRDTRGLFYEPLTDGSVNKNSLYAVTENKPCESYNIYAD